MNDNSIPKERIAELISEMVTDGMLDKLPDGVYQPSDKFIYTFQAMAKITEDRAKKMGTTGTKILPPDLFLDGILTTTFVHYLKFHLKVDTMPVVELEEKMFIIKTFYPESEFLKRINEVMAVS